MIYYLDLKGHVHNSPDRTVNHSYSSPLGMSSNEAVSIMDSFKKAFTVISITYK